MKHVHIILLCFLIYCIIPVQAQDTSSSLRQSIQSTLDSIVKKDQLPGLTYSVVLPDGQALDFAAGYADREAFQPMKTSSAMLVGSTGKTFVAALVLQQIEKGQLYLDAHLSDYFGKEAWYQALPNHEKITVRMLLQHSSGLPRYVFSKTFKKALKRNPEKTWEPQELIAMISHQDAVHPAGQGWAYSDTNYLLLGLLLEKITGQPYYTLLQKQILAPLALSSTVPSTQPGLPGLTQGYIGSHDILELGVKKTVANGQYVINPQFEWCGGGLMSTSSDLAKWIYQLHSGQLINTSMLAILRQPVSFDKGQPSEFGYGLGSFVWKIKDGDTHYGHEGIMPGYVTSIEYANDARIAMALQVNSDDGLTTSLHRYQLRLKEIITAHEEGKFTPPPPANQN